jgi:SAM-dependent methyltransferase
MLPRRALLALPAAVLTLHVSGAGAQTAAAPAGPAARQRLALVVGISRLGRQGVLEAAARDVQAVSAALRAAGFLVMQREDLSADALRADLDEFRTRLSPGAIGVVYLTALGAQADGHSFVLTRDVALPQGADATALGAALQRDAVQLDEVVQALAGQAGEPRALVVDAAWQHPLLAALPAPGLAEPAQLPPGLVLLLGGAPGQALPLPPAGAASALAREFVAALAVPQRGTGQVLRAVNRALAEGGRMAWVGGDTDDRIAVAEGAAAAAAAAAAPEPRTPAAAPRAERPAFVGRRNAFGHAEGDTYTFRHSDVTRGAVLGVQVLAIEAVRDDGTLLANGGELLLDAEGRVLRQRLRDGSVSRFEPAEALWWAAAKPGETREVLFVEKIERPGIGSGQAQWSGLAEAGALRRVALPAGEFEVLPVAAQGLVAETLVGQPTTRRRFVRTAWFAPALGHPVAHDIEDIDAEGRTLRRERLELLHAQTARHPPA